MDTESQQQQKRNRLTIVTFTIVYIILDIIMVQIATDLRRTISSLFTLPGKHQCA